MVRVRGDLLPFRGRVELRPRLLVAEMDGEYAAVEELETVVVSEVLRLRLPAETHFERHGGQFFMTR
jgi:hypothetical protein